MPDSNSNITRTNLVKRAFRRIGIDQPYTDQILQAVDLLNAVLKEIDTEGRWLWTINSTPSTLTLGSSQRAYDVGSGASNIASYIMALEQVDLVQGTTLRPIRIITSTESLTTYEREGTGEPYLVYLEKRPLTTSQRMHFFPTPNAAYPMQYTYRRRLYDFDNASDNPDFPQDWEQRLVKRLALELAPEFGIPLVERQLFKAESDEAMRRGRAANGEKADAIPQPARFY